MFFVFLMVVYAWGSVGCRSTCASQIGSSEAGCTPGGRLLPSCPSTSTCEMTISCFNVRNKITRKETSRNNDLTRSRNDKQRNTRSGGESQIGRPKGPFVGPACEEKKKNSDSEKPNNFYVTNLAHTPPNMEIAVPDLEELIVSDGGCDVPRGRRVSRDLAVLVVADKEGDMRSGPDPRWFARLRCRGPAECLGCVPPSMGHCRIESGLG